MNEQLNPLQFFRDIRSWIKVRRDFYEWLEAVEDKIQSGKHNAEIKKIIGQAKEELRVPEYDGSCLSCHIKCGSVCCYFSSGTLIEGVLIDKGLAARIKAVLEEKGMNPNDYMTLVKWGTLTSIQKKWIKKHYLLEEYLFNVQGHDVVCKTATSYDKPVPASLISKKPQTLDGLRLWVDSKSVACMFLKDDGRCFLGEAESAKLLGVRSNISADLRPQVCSLFICSTGYMLYVLNSLGVLRHSDYAGKTMHQLVSMTDDASKLLTRFLLTEDFM